VRLWGVAMGMGVALPHSIARTRLGDPPTAHRDHIFWVRSACAWGGGGGGGVEGEGEGGKERGWGERGGRREREQEREGGEGERVERERENIYLATN
jgi:hypothetical protein